MACLRAERELWELEHGPMAAMSSTSFRRAKIWLAAGFLWEQTTTACQIPKPDTQPELTKPVIYWVPVIAPGNLMFYHGNMFPQWKGSGFISGLATMALVRITLDGKGGAKTDERWSMGHRIRDIEEAPDGALWLLEDSSTGGVYRFDTEIKLPLNTDH